MSMMDPGIDPLLKVMAFKELAKIHEEFMRSREPRRKHSMFKKHLIIAIRNFGRLLVNVGQRLEQA